MSPVIAAAETFHEGGPSHPAFSESSVSTGGKAPSVFRAWVDCAEGGKWPKDFSPECCLLWCAPMSEIDMVQHLLFFSGFRCRCQQCGLSLSSVREGSGPPRRAALQALASSPSSVIPTKMSRQVLSSSTLWITGHSTDLLIRKVSTAKRASASPSHPSSLHTSKMGVDAGRGLMSAPT